MKPTTAMHGLMLLLISSCASLNISEIKNLEHTDFESIYVKPAVEVNNLRIDVIRQTKEVDNGESTKTEPVPYHPMGFDLGNGLFYDLNENLSLRIDYFLEFSDDKNFEILKYNRPEQNKGITAYRFANDSVFRYFPPMNKARYCYHSIALPDTTSYMFKRRLKYSIIETEQSLLYAGNKRVWEAIHKIDDSHYYLNKRKWRQEYQIIGNDIYLENDLVVSLTNDHTALEINRQGRKRHWLLHTIEQNDDKLFIYDRNYNGLKIEKNKNHILIYNGNMLLSKYEIKRSN